MKSQILKLIALIALLTAGGFTSMAQKVRSTKGLTVHVFGKIAAAFIFLIF